MNKDRQCDFCQNARNGLAEQYGCLAVCIITVITGFCILRLIWRLFV